MNQDLFDAILTGSGLLLGAGLPVILVMLVKDFLANFVAGIQIKLNTNFQYINSFEFEGRRKCRVSNIHLSTIEIQDMESDQFITVYNKDFLKVKVWRNIERSRRDT